MRRALEQVRAMASWIESGGRLPLSALSDSRAWFSEFLRGSHQPSGPQAAELSRALRASSRFRRVLGALDYPALVELADHLPDLDALHARIENTIDEKGEVLASASPKLGRTRTEIARVEREIQVTLDRLLRTPTVQKLLQAPRPVWRNGRPALQVRPECRKFVRGIVHDRSQTGQTLFIEPESVVEPANRLGELEAEERAEVQRVLAELMRELFVSSQEILQTLNGLAWIDFTVARARLVHELGFVIPEVGVDGCFQLRDARHPLLMRPLFEGRWTQEQARSAVVPLDIDLGDPYTMLVVTGPNTGGKTVALKTVGVSTLMAQAGLPVPARSARLPCVDAVFADIGDEQAIEQSLSTFSSHIVRIERALEAATPRSLVLLDELGAGTDPEEGGALGYAMLEALHERGVPTIAVTHLSRLKDFAYEHRGVENGSMAFDPDDLRPLYRLDVGVPGASQALHVASAVGVAPQIVARAREILGDRDSRIEEMIDRIQRTRKAAAEQRREAEAAREQAEGEAHEVRRKAEEVERRESWIREEAEHFVEEELRAARDVLAEPLRQFLNAPRPYDEKAKGLLLLLEGLLSRSSLGRRRDRYLASVKKGFMVYVPRFRRRCKVLKVERKRRILTVEAGDLKMEVSFEDVSWLQPL